MSGGSGSRSRKPPESAVLIRVPAVVMVLAAVLLLVCLSTGSWLEDSDVSYGPTGTVHVAREFADDAEKKCYDRVGSELSAAAPTTGRMLLIAVGIGAALVGLVGAFGVGRPALWRGLAVVATVGTALSASMIDVMRAGAARLSSCDPSLLGPEPSAAATGAVVALLVLAVAALLAGRPASWWHQSDRPPTGDGARV